MQLEYFHIVPNSWSLWHVIIINTIFEKEQMFSGSNICSNYCEVTIDFSADKDYLKLQPVIVCISTKEPLQNIGKTWHLHDLYGIYIPSNV